MANYPFSNQRAVELAKMVMRGHHALGGTAGRSHFEGGGDAAANAVAVDPNIEHASDVNTQTPTVVTPTVTNQVTTTPTVTNPAVNTATVTGNTGTNTGTNTNANQTTTPVDYTISFWG